MSCPIVTNARVSSSTGWQRVNMWHVIIFMKRVLVWFYGTVACMGPLTGREGEGPSSSAQHHRLKHRPLGPCWSGAPGAGREDPWLKVRVRVHLFSLVERSNGSFYLGLCFQCISMEHLMMLFPVGIAPRFIILADPNALIHIEEPDISSLSSWSQSRLTLMVCFINIFVWPLREGLHHFWLGWKHQIHN